MVDITIDIEDQLLDPSERLDSHLLESSDKLEDDKICRICLEDESEGLFSPCRCSGTSKYVHRNCLNQWRIISSNPESKTHCGICHYRYNIHHIDYGPCYRNCMVIINKPCSFVPLLVFLIYFIGYILELFDKDYILGKFVINLIGSDPDEEQNDPTKLIYYNILSGYIILTCVLLGILYSFIRIKFKIEYLRQCCCNSETNYFLFIFRIFVPMVLLMTLFVSFEIDLFLGTTHLAIVIFYFIHKHITHIKLCNQVKENMILPYQPESSSS